MHDIARRVYDTDGASPTLHTCAGGKLETKIIVDEEGNNIINGKRVRIRKLTEKDAFEICKKYDLLSPMYSVDGIYRGGCWFCPKQCLADLHSLWKTYPDLWQRLCDMEPDSHNTFKPNCTLAELQARFESGYVPVRRKQRATEKQISIEEYLGAAKREIKKMLTK